MVEELYRYDTISYESGPKITLKTYPVVSETPKGYWISKIPKGYWINDHLGFYTRNKDRWVQKNGNKVFARSTKEAALYDLKCRKSRYRSIMKARVSETETILDMIDDMERRTVKTSDNK